MERTIATCRNDIDKWFAENNHDSLAFDTELLENADEDLSWDNLNIESICFYNGKEGLLVSDINLMGYLVGPFDSVKKLIAHNIVFDLKVLKRTELFNYWFNHVLDKVELYDTMVAQHLINENEPSLKLKDLAKTKLGKAETITWQQASKFKKNSQEWFDYCFNDVLYAWDLMKYQEPLLVQEGVDKLFKEIEMPFQRCLVDMEVNGMLVDREKMATVLVDLKKEHVQLTKDMLLELKLPHQVQKTLEGEYIIKSPINFNSSQQLGKILFEDLGLPIIERTEGGSPSVGKLTLEQLQEKSKFVKLLYRYKIIQKLITAFYESIPEHISNDGRIRPHFSDCGTVTGRLSCSSPNIQQLPKVRKDFTINVRDCFIASPGTTMFTADFSGQEIRVMAEISKEPTLIDSLIKGKDIHLAVANQFYNLNIPEEALYENSPLYKVYKDKFKEERAKAKIITFGLCYGKGAYGFSKDFNISEDAAKLIVDKYFQNMPKLKQAIDQTHNELRRNGYVNTLTGRKRRFEKVRRGDWIGYVQHSYRQSFNHKIQGLSADMIRIAMINIRNKAKEHPEYNLKLLATVHDEVIVEADTKFIKEVKELLKESFESSMKFVVPLPADIGHGNSYGSAK